MFGTRYWLAVFATVIAAAALSTEFLAPESARSFAGSGSCSGGNCSFCSDVTLTHYGTGSPDRCAYGHFSGLDGVTNHHTSGAVKLCAGAKTNRDGSGGNADPLGFACSSSKMYVFTLGDFKYRNTPGYATIANGDGSATHYHFSGTATY
jgi:hypothetical protein